MKYRGWVKPKEVFRLRHWLFHIWNEYELWHWGVAWDGIRIFGFEFEPTNVK